MEDDIIDSLYGAIRTVPDFPIEGIMFRDITPVLADGELLTSLVDRMVTDMDALGWQPTHIAGPESRGFIFGSMVADRLAALHSIGPSRARAIGQWERQCKMRSSLNVTGTQYFRAATIRMAICRAITLRGSLASVKKKAS